MELGVRSDEARPKPIEQWFALLAGVGYVLIGVVGFFFTGFNDFVGYTGDGIPIFGLFFGLNSFHNVVHLGVGALWLLAAFVLIQEASEGINLAIAGVYVLAAVLGYFGFLTQLLSIRPDTPLAPDNFLHLFTGVIALLMAGFRTLLMPQRSHAGAR